MSLLHRIALTSMNDIGPVLAKNLLAYFGDEEAIFKASKAKLLTVPGIGEKKIAQLDFDEALRKAETELKFIEKNDIEVLFYTDSKYPKRLKNCHDSPILLYSKGNADLNMYRVLSVV